jgi:hypothetical protein
MFTVECSLNLLHYFHSCTLANEVLNFFRVDITSPTAEEDSPIPSDKETHGSFVEEPAKVALHLSWCSFPLMEVLEFRASSTTLVPLLCGLENDVIIGSALPIVRFLIIDLIEYGYLLVVDVSYDTPELH